MPRMAQRPKRTGGQMLVRKQQNVPRRPSSSELNALAGHAIFCSEFKYRRGTEIFGEAEPIEYLYQVKSGAVRSYKLLADGRRQIMAFHLPGDIFGVENGAVHRFTAEAIVETTVHLTDRQNVVDKGRGSATVSTNIMRLVTSSLQHAETHMLLLGRKTAIEKVAAFLIEMDVRLGYFKPPNEPSRYRRLSWADAGDGVTLYVTAEGS